MRETVQPIIDYYEQCEQSYRILWDLDQSHAMHFGFWDETTLSLSDALRRENEVIAQFAQVTATDRVLDAGCGVGGTSIFLIEKYGCDVVGITLCEKQVIQARLYAKKRKTTPLPQFETMDFTTTTFLNESFDVIIAIESVCHTREKAAFIAEAFRLLKKGGRLAVADGFKSQKKIAKEDEQLLKAYGDGWAGCTWDARDVFEQKLKKQGFDEIAYQNATEQVFPSLKLLNDFHLLTGLSPDSELSEDLDLPQKLRVKNGVSTGYYQYQCYKKKLLEFGLFFARKNQSVSSRLH